MDLISVRRRGVERKMKEFQKKNMQYRKIFEFSPQAIGIIDMKGNVLEVNRRLCGWLGYQPEEVIGKNFLQLPFLSEESKITVKGKLARVFRADNIPPYDVEFVTKAGERRAGRIFTSPVKDEKGNLMEILFLAFDITEQRKAEQALRESEELFRSIVENSHAGILIVDDSYHFLYVNDELCRILGYPQEEIVGQDFRRFLDEESRKLVADRYMKRQRGEKIPSRYEFNVIRKDGEKRRVEISSTVVKDKSGQLRSVAQILDITERRQAEEALKESIKDYRGLFENAHDAIFVFTPEKEIILNVNPRACELYGFSREEFIGMSLESISKNVTQGKERIKKTLENGVYHNFETVHYRKDGSEILLDVNAAVVNYKGQKAILSAHRDITKRKKAEERLQVEKAYLDRLFESAQEGIVMSDREGRVMRVNNEFMRLFGYKREEVLGRNIDELVMPSKYLNNGISITNKVVAGENVDFEAVRQQKDGKLIDVSVLASPIIADGEVVAIFAIYRDITERKRAEEKLRSALKEREVMLREIHHRVKNNMQIISSLLRLQSRQIRNKKILDLFNVGQNRIRSMALIHESLYQSSDMAKINFSDYINRLTTHLLSTYRVDMERIRMKVDVRDIYLDINRAIPCGLVINELVSNSLRHAFPESKKGDVKVIMKANKQDKYSLVVKDTGVGFPEDVDFRQTESLGMQLVIDLISQLRGTIRLKRDKGTEFRVVF